MSQPQLDTEPDLRDRSIAARDPIAIVPGTRIDRYVVLSRLGVGGMGVVLAAYDPQLDRRVALKVLHGAEGGRESREARRLVREAMAMARLTHPNVITVHDVGEHDGQVYISMELVEGSTLKQRLAAKPAWPEVLELFIAAGRGLAGAHAKGLVHRDFKPDNVMVGDDGRVRVMDFGLAHDTSPDSSGSASMADVALVPRSGPRSDGATHADRIAGTPGYIAPELHRGEPADPRSDQFAFGVALYEGLFGQRPFEGESMFELAAAAMAGRVRAIPASSDVPGWVRRIVVRALASDAGERFATMDALLEALGQRSARQVARRRLAVAIGAVAVIGATVGTLVVSSQRAVARCEADGAVIDEVWNDEIRTRVRAGFMRDAPAYAAVAWDKSTVWIDRYVEDWRRMRTEVCTATDIEQRRSSELQLASIACLDERRRVLDAVVHQLEAGGETIAYAAVDATSDLPAIAACMDDAALARAPAQPDDPARLELAERLDEAIALGLAGRTRESVELARDAVQRADAIDDSVAGIAARLHLASGLAELAEYDDAVTQAEAAFFLAGRAGDDAAAAEAASTAASIAGFDLRNAELAVRWVPLAEMSLTRLGEQETPRVGRCLFDLGRAEIAAAHYDHAVELLERARAIYERELDPEHPRVAQATVHLGIVALDRGDYAQAEQLNADAIALLERAFGPDHPALGAAINNMGNALDARGQPERAMPMYQRALALWQRSLGESHPSHAETLLNIAVVHYELGEYETAIAESQQALASFERTLGPSSPQVANCLNNMVNFVASAGDFTTALDYQRRALEIREATLPADHPELAGSHAQYGILVAAMPDADAETLTQARSSLERSISILDAKFGPDHPQASFPHNALGQVLARQHQYDAALVELEHALRLRSGEDTPGYSRAETLFAIADVLRQAHRDPARARALAGEAKQLWRAAGPTFDPQRGDAEAFLAAD